MSKKQKHSLHDHIGFWLNKFGQEVAVSFQARLAKENITGPQWCILITIYNDDGASVVEIANFIGIDKGAISRVVDQLVTMGLIKIAEGQDRRSKTLALTDKGEKLTVKLAEQANINDEVFFAVLSSAEKKQLQSILKKLLNHAGIHAMGGWLTK